MKQKMINSDDVPKTTIREHNTNWPEIPDHTYRILIAGCSGCEKTNALLNQINHEPDIDRNLFICKVSI